MNRQTTKPTACVSPARQLEAFISKFDPAVARLTRASLRILRKRFSTAYELVYDNYNALAIGWSQNSRTSEVVCSLAVYAPRRKSERRVNGSNRYSERRRPRLLIL